MKAQNWFLAAGVAGAVSLAVVALKGSDEGAPAAPPPATSPTTAPAEPAPVAVAAPAARTGCRFERGQRLDVALSVASSVALSNAPAPIPQGTLLAESLEATARLEVLEADPTRAVLLGEFVEAKTSGQAPADAWTRPFLLEVDPSCELRRFARHQQTPAADARLEQAALWELSWRWTPVDEVLLRTNGRGSYRARATTARVGDETLAQRRTEAYGQLWLGGTAQGVTGFSSVTVGSAGWFDSLKSDETLETSTGTTKTRVRATARPGQGALAHLDREASHYLWEDLLPRQLARREAPPVTAGDKKLRAEVQDKTAAEAVQLAQDKFTAEQNLATAWPPLRAWLEAHPERTEEVAAQLRAGKVSEDGLNPFFIAMGNARTPEARDALLAMLRDTKAPPAIRARAMFSVIDRADVGVELAQEFANQSQALESSPTGSTRFVAGEALLAVSTMAGLHDEPAIRGVATSAVLSTLATDDGRSQGTALRALANLGDPALLPHAAPYTRSPNERVRRAAAKVVRRMNPQDTDAFVLEWLAREPSLFVKKDLLVTIEAQHFDARIGASPALTRALLRELADEGHAVIARKALVRLVGASSISSEATVREALKAQARRALRKKDGLANDVFELLSPDEMREVAP